MTILFFFLEFLHNLFLQFFRFFLQAFFLCFDVFHAQEERLKKKAEELQKEIMQEFKKEK